MLPEEHVPPFVLGEPVCPLFPCPEGARAGNVSGRGMEGPGGKLYRKLSTFLPSTPSTLPQALQSFLGSTRVGNKALY